MSNNLEEQTLNSDPGLDFESCSVLLFDPQIETRYQSADALKRIGFNKIHHARDMETLEKAYHQGGYDLLIGDTTGAQSSICEFIHKVRHHTFGSNPFVGIFLTTWSPSEENVRRAVNSGTDHLIAKPFSFSQVSNRVKAIVDDRKPFVVTVNYVGPDRRIDQKRGAEIEHIDVPNSLRAKAANDPDFAATPDNIERVMGEINAQKIRRYDLQIGVLIEMITRSMDRDLHPKTLTARFKKLAILMNDLLSRIRNTGYADAAKTCGDLVAIVRDMETNERADPEQIKQLREIAMAMHLYFNPEKTASDISAEILDTVQRIEMRTALPGARNAAAMC